jgi:hypothetical protein
MDGRLVVLRRFVEALGEPLDISTVNARKRFQKAVYLGQLTGIDLGYRYSWYVRGPYSTPLTQDYYALSAALAANEQMPPNSNLKPEVAQRLQSIRELLTPPADAGLDRSDWYELLASWHYLQAVSRKSPQDARRTIQKQKINLYPHIDAADAALKRHRLLNG